MRIVVEIEDWRRDQGLRWRLRMGIFEGEAL